MATIYTSSNISNFEEIIEDALQVISNVVGGVGADPIKLAKYAEAIHILTEAQKNVDILKKG